MNVFFKSNEHKKIRRNGLTTITAYQDITFMINQLF